MSLLAAVSLDMGPSLSAGVNQPAPALLLFLLHLEEENKQANKDQGN